MMALPWKILLFLWDTEGAPSPLILPRFSLQNTFLGLTYLASTCSFRPIWLMRVLSLRLIWPMGVSPLQPSRSTEVPPTS